MFTHTSFQVKAIKMDISNLQIYAGELLSCAVLFYLHCLRYRMVRVAECD
jgi:hypothetical protein